MNFFNTFISPYAIRKATQTLRSGHVSEGRLVQEFEKTLATRLGLYNPIAVNSGTAAMHLALVLSRVGPGDEVILPPQTFVATGLVILMQRAVPVFADIDRQTGCLSPEGVAAKITSRTRAIMPVHWGGYPADLDEIHLIAKQYNISVIEDAAHALGATYKKKPIGGISRFTAFSFQAIKHMTTGDGGALCCLDEEDARQARIMRWFGIDRANTKKSLIGGRQCDISVLGYKYHMNDLAAAIGLGNIKVFSKELKRRQKYAARYVRELSDVPGLQLLAYQPDRESAYWLFTVLVEKRLQFAKAMIASRIPVSVVDLRIDSNSIFGEERQDLPNMAWFNERQIGLPLHGALRDEDVSRVIRAIRRGW